MREVRFFDNSKINFTYDELERLETETNELGQTTRYEYDELSRINAIINAKNERTDLEYDHRQNLVKITDALGHTTRYTYDEYDRHIATEYQTGEKIEMVYDDYNRLTQVIDENFHPTKYFYNNLSQLTVIEEANGAVTNYGYDNLGRRTTVENANQKITTYEYDAFNRIESTILPLTQSDRTVYNKYGLVESHTDFNGDTINYSYDGYGRLERKSFTNSDIDSVFYAYDPVTSQIRTITDGRGDTTYTYDDRDRLASITQPDGKFVEYRYDFLNNLTALTTNAGTVEYSYDALNYLETVKQDGQTLADYDYDLVGNLVRVERGNGTVETLGYDDRDRLTSLLTKDANETIISSYTYRLDGAGNRKQVVEHSGRIVDYLYDNVNRLTEEKISNSSQNRTINYGYDLVGNREFRHDSIAGNITYSYDDNNRLLQTILGTQITDFTYDDNGSLRSRTDGTNTATYDWINDGENRLIAATITTPEGLSEVNYAYDAEGHRVSSSLDGVTTNYLVTPGLLSQVLLESDESGNITTEYIYGLDLISAHSEGNTTFFHGDALGSTRVLTDAAGEVTDRYSYGAYGRLFDHQGSSDNPYQFTGEWQDTATGLDYLRARYYDPDLGRFISKDAFGGLISDPMSQHDYQYAHANPVTFSDPTGYFTLREAVTAVSLAGILVGVGSSATYVGNQYLMGDGISGEQGLEMFDQWISGFGHGVSGGITTAIVRDDYGEIQAGDHAFLWNMGNLAGVSVSFILGFKLPLVFAGQLGAARWATSFAVGLDAAAMLYGGYEGIVGLTDGVWDYSDAFNLLSLVPFAVPAIAMAGKSMKTIRSANRIAGTVDEVTPPTGSVDDVLQGSQQTWVNLESGFDISKIPIPKEEGVPGFASLDEVIKKKWLVGSGPSGGVVLTDSSISPTKLGKLWELSESKGVEYSLVKIKDTGKVTLYSGSPGSVPVPIDTGVIHLGHTHPTTGGIPEELPSIADINVLNKLWEKLLKLDPEAPPPTSVIIWGPNPGNVTPYSAVDLTLIKKPKKKPKPPKQKH